MTFTTIAGIFIFQIMLLKSSRLFTFMIKFIFPFAVLLPFCNTFSPVGVRVQILVRKSRGLKRNEVKYKLNCNENPVEQEQKYREYCIKYNKIMFYLFLKYIKTHNVLQMYIFNYSFALVLLVDKN